MSNINLPRVPPAKPPSVLSLQRTKLLIAAALVAVALVGGRALLGRGSPEAPAAASPAR
jgi:hypothetical protein